ncbi:peptide chain release factor N(5)-glutamine methyltransferase [Aeoliella sp. ICT_H6.2]|uniref:Release factor glutamine methyltransferase n=1 Tax=Aeoliella straminimaris TaxID=2954799 RepID=A0A9X2FC45_9BACT|nr:peptide chain release factor N(5)-glutamine methyltransferase [Aeoliella straminimaris]MCO6043609.1 peptide chain release factor N(5)-glutamine methyltransferase [Aeoliella straminimaris]
MSTPVEAKPDPDAWTIGRLLNWTTDFFTQRGVESARLEAEVLLAHCRGCQRILLYTAFDEPASEQLREKFRALVRERAAGKPVAYLVGKREFYSHDFEVTPDVLIPRPETELLVVGLLDHAKEQGRAAEPLALADVGTGSGIIAICAAMNLKAAHVTALDLSTHALEVAQRNAEKHHVAERIEFVESDLFAAVNDGVTYDFIASNPPYITTAELAELDKSVKDFEPMLALDGGAEGTTVVERLIAEATTRLKPGGILMMEISPMIAARVEQLVTDSPLEKLETLKDLDGHARIVQARQKGAA